MPGARFTVATGVNDAGQVAGYYAVAVGAGGNHGFLLSEGAYTTLDPPGSIWTEAWGINASGQVVGVYTDGMRSVHGFVATPTPAPSTILHLGVGTLGLLGYACTRRRGTIGQGRPKSGRATKMGRETQ